MSEHEVDDRVTLQDLLDDGADFTLPKLEALPEQTLRDAEGERVTMWQDDTIRAAIESIDERTRESDQESHWLWRARRSLEWALACTLSANEARRKALEDQDCFYEGDAR